MRLGRFGREADGQLKMEGFGLRIAHKGQSTLKIAQEFRPDVVLLDIGLLGMNAA